MSKSLRNNTGRKTCWMQESVLLEFRITNFSQKHSRTTANNIKWKWVFYCL